MITQPRATRRWQDWSNLVLGCWLFIAPWLLATTRDGTSSWNAWLFGAVLVIVSLIVLNTPRNVTLEWTNAILGLWMLISPWVLGFSTIYAAAWDTAIVGLLVIVVAYSAVYTLQHGKPTSAGPQQHQG